MRPVAVVTGGAGFIGVHLVRALLDQGRRVRVVDNFSTGVLENVPPEAEILEGDVNLVAGLAVADSDVIFHLASNPSVGFSVNNPDDSYVSVAASTAAILSAAETYGCRKLVLSSSCSVYGDKDRPGPASPYARAKLAAEEYCAQARRRLKVDPVVLRIFNAYGPGQSEQGTFVVPSFVRRALQSRPLVVNGDGFQSRDFIYVDDVVRALLAAEGKSSAIPIDVGTGRSTTILSLAREVGAVVGVGSASVYWHIDPKEGESRSARADISMMSAILGIRETVPLREGLERTVSAMRRTQ